jgi:hypothetical protein
MTEANGVTRAGYGGKKWENIFAVISNGKSSISAFMFQYHF